jgi:hypothetical protein
MFVSSWLLKTLDLNQHRTERMQGEASGARYNTCAIDESSR